MSVDTRLRQARPDEDSRWEAGLDLALAGVVRSARRRRTRHAAVAAGSIAAVLAVGGLAVTHSSDSDPRPAPAVPSPTAPSPITSLPRTSPLDGQWTTGRVDRQDVVTALVDAGIDPAVAGEYATGRLPQGTFRMRMVISQGILQGHVSHRGDTWAQFVSVEDGSLTMTPMLAGFGHWTYGWQLDGERLSLDLRRTTVPAADGFSSWVNAVAMFGVAPFIREG